MTSARGLVGAFGVALTLAGTPAFAVEAIAVQGQVSDEDFYRLVSCAAPPGGDCTKTPLRWETVHVIRIALRRIDPEYVGRRKWRAEAALTRAVQEVNDAGAGFHLSRVREGDPAEIEVFFLGLETGATIAGTGLPWVDGAELGELATRLAVEPGGETIKRAAILVSTSLDTAAYEPRMLSALTSATGLTTLVKGDAYAGLSVLAEPPGEVTRLAPQDIAALRAHYERN